MKQYANQRSKVFRNSRRMNRLEELGRVDAEKAKTRMGKKNLKDEKKIIVRELKAKGGSVSMDKIKKALPKKFKRMTPKQRARLQTRLGDRTAPMKKERLKKADGGSLKPVKPSQKGLKKLPTKVRNKMGYMKKGGRVGMGKAMRGGGCVR